jgi:glutamate-1-semialdehyde 2,1-aminomutase
MIVFLLMPRLPFRSKCELKLSTNMEGMVPPLRNVGISPCAGYTKSLLGGLFVGYLEDYKARTPGSAALYERAVQVMPGGICHNPRYFAPYPLYINKAEGPKIWDVDGHEYVDLWMGHYVHVLGHKPEPIYSEIKKSVDIGTHWGIVNEYQIEFAEELIKTIPSFERLRFGVSGTEATMYAVRLARAFTGRKTILKVKGGWHGANSDLGVAVHAPMDVPESAGIFGELTRYSKLISFNDKAGCLKAIEENKNDLAAVVMEAVGQYFVPPDPGFVEAVIDATKKAGGVFVLDEIITGGRLSVAGAQGRYSLKPDLTTMGKVMGAGLNLGLVAGRKDILDLAKPGLPKGQGVMMGGGTFSAMIPAMIAGNFMLKYLKANAATIYPELDRKGEYVRNGVQDAFRAEGIPCQCLGVGSLFSTSFPATHTQVLKNCEDIEVLSDVKFRDGEFKIRMLNHGVYTIWGGGAISYSHGEKELNHIIDAARAVAKEMAASKK